MKKLISLLVVSFMLLSATNILASAPKEYKEQYVVVKVKADGKKDVSDDIQKIIDSNPNRTLFFPDGVYLICKPICTPADPRKSVALELSNFAVIKAQKEWAHEEAMIRLGGKDPFNNITTPGSNYYLQGGVIDGSGVAKGVSIDSGRETSIRNTSIKNVSLGLHVKHGANSGSSDADIFNVNITGNNSPDCIGVLVEGFDNTFTNMRIGGVQIGFLIRSEANVLRNIHPLYYSKPEQHATSCGFIDERQNNWYDFCYSDEFAVGFKIKGGRSIYNNCFVFWYSNKAEKHVAFKSEGEFNSDVMSLNVGFGKHNAVKENKILEVDNNSGNGMFFNLHVGDPTLVTDNSHLKYMR